MFKFKVDYYLAIPALLLSFLGLLVLRSVSSQLVLSQLGFVVIAALFFVFLSALDYKIIFSLHLPIYILSVVFLCVPFIFNITTRGTHRWLQIGQSTLQPSELIKPLLLITFSVIAVSAIKHKSWFLIASVLLPGLIIFFQPDLGTSIVLSIGWVTALFFQLKTNKLIALLLLVAVVSPLFYIFALHDYQKQRIQTFIDPYKDPLDRGYHVIQSAIAVGSGQVFGRGLGRGTQSQLRFLPEQHTDFVFSSLSEELGFLGGALVIVLYFYLFWRIYKISQSVSDPEASLFCLASLAMLSFQVFVNIGMNIGIAPVTGITLPLLSYGGSSLLSIGITLGIVNSIARETNRGRTIQIT
jgi:rod shape determining protein RodA